MAIMPPKAGQGHQSLSAQSPSNPRIQPRAPEPIKPPDSRGYQARLMHLAFGANQGLRSWPRLRSAEEAPGRRRRRTPRAQWAVINTHYAPANHIWRHYRDGPAQATTRKARLCPGNSQHPREALSPS
uniref:Uncharacterized protein n=2 Tax=Oryza TaxID=4527 RepID=Q2QW84_ORYSJ|nr:hypothetical protein LOC_Os12g10230 [Oryza sativa Japonica Group]